VCLPGYRRSLIVDGYGREVAVSVGILASDVHTERLHSVDPFLPPQRGCVGGEAGSVIGLQVCAGHDQ